MIPITEACKVIPFNTTPALRSFENYFKDLLNEKCTKGHDQIPSAVSGENSKFFSSQFLNIYISFRDSILLFHSVTGAIDEIIFKDNHQNIHCYQSQKIDIDYIPASMMEYFIRRGYLTGLNPISEIIEFSKYCDILKQEELSNTLPPVHLRIIPSYSCNLNCNYCFQNNYNLSSQTMTKNQIKKIFDITIPDLIHRFSDQVSITIFGGEPFAPQNISATHDILSKSLDRKYPVWIVTNGLGVIDKIFINEETKKLISVHITLHEKTNWHLGNNSKTNSLFNQFLENTKYFADLGVAITIQILVTHKAAKYLNRLADIFYDHGLLRKKNVKLICRPVTDCDTQQKQAVKHTASYISRSDLTDLMRKENITPQIQSPLSYFKPLYQTLFSGDDTVYVKDNYKYLCSKSAPIELTIDSSDNVYSCFLEAGNHNTIVGQININGTIDLSDEYFSSFTPITGSAKSCLSCSIALICGGMCPMRYSENSGQLRMKDCKENKLVLEQCITELHQSKIRDQF